MEIRVLRYFLEIARESNMSRAAKALHEVFNDPCQIFDLMGFRTSDMNLPSGNVIQFPKFIRRFIHHCKDIFRPLPQQHSLVCQADTGTAPAKQLFSKFGFQLFHLFR